MVILPTGTLPVIMGRDELSDTRLQGRKAVILHDENKYDGYFFSGEGAGYKGFLDHAKLLKPSGEPYPGTEDLTILQAVNLASETATYAEQKSIDTLLEDMHEDTRRYLGRRNITLDDVRRRLEYGYYEDTLTTCCGEPGCGSTYGLIRAGKCDIRFDVSAASLVSIEFFPFEIISS